MTKMLNLLWAITPDFIGNLVHRLTSCWWTKFRTNHNIYYRLEAYPRPALDTKNCYAVKGDFRSYFEAALERGAVPLENIIHRDGDVIMFCDPKLNVLISKPKSQCEVI